ncbi:MAG: hypothetical protein KJ558_16530 [Gammaproteobacteria bacterium]|nr:hypothetical protein [Gammaproteobacteria bacterium]MBU1656398.1 hypothetical protein [Gammaproteobacteria bacterium]MBU1960946.1 hypothetical protein [Gammaproteobacteria bacterium]
MPLNRCKTGLSAILLLLLTAPSAGQTLDEKGYLDAITLEAEKVEQRQTGEQADSHNPHSAATQVPPAPSNSAQPGLTMQQFEEKLKQDYLGTYSLYMKLSQRSKEEIYDSHARGASLDSLREKVLIRYNHDNTKN